jgi:hypothetical protein
MEKRKERKERRREVCGEGEKMEKRGKRIERKERGREREKYSGGPKREGKRKRKGEGR